MPEWDVVAAGEEAVDIGLGVPVFVAVAGVAEKAFVAEAFQVAVFHSEESHKGFVVIECRETDGSNLFFHACQSKEDLVKGFSNRIFIFGHGI